MELFTNMEFVNDILQKKQEKNVTKRSKKYKLNKTIEKHLEICRLRMKFLK